MHAQCETPKPCIEDYVIGVKSQIYNDLLTRHNCVFKQTKVFSKNMILQYIQITNKGMKKKNKNKKHQGMWRMKNKNCVQIYI